MSSLCRLLLLSLLLSGGFASGQTTIAANTDSVQLAQPATPAAPPNTMSSWSWPKRIAFVAIIMGAIVIVSQTLGKYEWPAEWGGLPKEGGIPIRPEDQLAKREAAAKAKRNGLSAEGQKPDVPEF